MAVTSVVAVGTAVVVAYLTMTTVVIVLWWQFSLTVGGLGVVLCSFAMCRLLFRVVGPATVRAGTGMCRWVSGRGGCFEVYDIL